MMVTSPPNLTVIVLTFNEEANLDHCLGSIQGWARDIYVVDSYSTDNTLDIAQRHGIPVYQHEWPGFAGQRNWALDNLPISTEWVFFLDADEMISPPLWQEIVEKINQASPEVAGFAIRQEYYFLGRCVRRAFSAMPMIRLVRKDRAHWITVEGFNEKCLVEGRVALLQSRVLHWDRKGLSSWIARHNRNAPAMAEDLLHGGEVTHDSIVGMASEDDVHWSRRLKNLAKRVIPLQLNPFLRFFYCYVLRGGFLDGKAGFAYVFLHELWFRLLVYWLTVEKSETIGRETNAKSFS